MDASAPDRELSIAGFRRLFDQYVWTRNTFVALALVSSNLVSTIGGLIISAAVEHWIERLTQRRTALSLEIYQLDRLAGDFEGRELLRMSFLAALKGSNADDGLKYGVDQLYRVDSQGTLRRLTAVLYPETWRDKGADYDALLSSGYGNLEAVQKLTAMENEVIAAARARITSDQQAFAAASGKIDRLSPWRNAAQIVLSGITGLLTVLAFLYKAERGS